MLKLPPPPCAVLLVGPNGSSFPPILKYITKKILLECIASIHFWVPYWEYFMLKWEANPMKGGRYIGQFGPQKAKWGKGSTYFDMHSWGMLRTFWDTIVGVIIGIPLCILRHQSWRWQLHGTPISIYKPTTHYYCQQSFGVNTTFSRTPVWPSSRFLSARVGRPKVASLGRISPMHCLHCLYLKSSGFLMVRSSHHASHPCR